MPRERDDFCTELGSGEADEGIDPSSFAGFQAGRRIALASGCALSPEAMSLIARVQFDKHAQYTLTQQTGLRDGALRTQSTKLQLLKRLLF